MKRQIKYAKDDMLKSTFESILAFKMRSVTSKDDFNINAEIVF